MGTKKKISRMLDKAATYVGNPGGAALGDAVRASMMPDKLSAAKSGNKPKGPTAKKSASAPAKKSGYGSRGSNDWD